MDKRTLLLLSWFEKLSDEDRRALVQYLSDGNRVSEVNKKIDNQTQELSTLIRKEGSFSKDLLANIAGNAITDGTVYLLSRLLRFK